MQHKINHGLDGDLKISETLELWHHTHKDY